MRKQALAGLTIACDDPTLSYDPHNSSLQFTDNGSMLYKGYKIGDKGVQASPDGRRQNSGMWHSWIQYPAETPIFFPSVWPASVWLP